MKYRTIYKIVFSHSRSYRWKRHLLFWLAVLLYHVVRIGIMFPTISNFNLFLSVMELAVFWGVVINLFFSYSVVYYLVPKYFQKNKFLFLLAIVVVFAIVQIIGLVHTVLINGTPATNAIGYEKLKAFWAFSRACFIRLFGNPPLICGLLFSLKTLKNWHLEQLKTETLAKENASAELQLLKAQVHPHFLFNTLNNIYSFALNRSPQAGSLVRRLSNMLHYMVNECEQSYVPLPKEIKLIQDYLELEKVRYGERLTLQVEISGSYTHQSIAPLLLIPFIENCFKHGASVTRGKQWIKLNMRIEEDGLNLNLSNSKPLQPVTRNLKRGIGLSNVQKRLELLYPQKHVLEIESTGDSYSVHLQLHLQLVSIQDFSLKPLPNLQPAYYE